MEIRRYRPEDCEEMARLFFHTVHTVNAADYTEQQLDAWADGQIDLKTWQKSFAYHYSLIAQEDGQIVGFGDMRSDGYLDRLYVHADHQNEGIGSALCDQLEESAETQIITVHASITARPFFERRGYRLIRQQQVERKGVLLTNYVMEKTL